MTERLAARHGVHALLVAALCWLLPGQGARAQVESLVTVGYLQIEGDPRYEPRPTYAGIMKRPRGRPYAGAETALRESRIVARALGVRFALERQGVASADEMLRALGRLRAEHGVGIAIVDADAQTIADVARRTRGQGLVLLNVSASEDELRHEQCEAHLLHVHPSDAMLTDALAQFVVWRRWRRVVVLKGPLPQDARLAEAFERSARKFGAEVVASRDFVLSNDPRQRAQNNVALLTAGVDHDVVFLADTDGEFGRYVPYQTSRPRPVIGTEGLVADAWHWSWERHGAPQLSQRFERTAGRRMQASDWAAWAAVKLIVEAVTRTRSTAPEVLASFVRSGEMRLDGYKGSALSFRSWDNQLRQGIFLHTHNAVVASAPLAGFLHATENLDTLGPDRPESRCSRVTR
jgi:ABC transporter substrate binding protein (PQQ-dependent alcohol dehydrogenase system)